MADKNESALTTGEKRCVVGLGFCGPGAGSNTSVADVKDGKLVRLRPLHLDWKYDPKQFNPWKMEARGKTFEPRLKSLIPPFSLAYKKRVYSSNRVLYPLKRVDFAITPHNRTSKNATGMVCSSFLVEVEKVTEAQMNERKEKYPEAFNRPYDPAQGVCLAGWLEEGEL